jgi:hypothetical protein
MILSRINENLLTFRAAIIEGFNSFFQTFLGGAGGGNAVTEHKDSAPIVFA